MKRAISSAIIATGLAWPAGASNLETVQNLYGAFGAGDIPAILAMLSDEVEWDHGYEDTSVATLVPRTGPDEVVGFFEELGALEFKRFDVVNMLEGGNQVVAVIELEVVGKETGREFADQELHLWTFGDDGKVASFRHFLDMEEYARVLSD